MQSRLPLVHRTIFAVRGEREDLEDFLLVIADPKIKNEDGVGRIIEQSNSKAFTPEVIFDAKGVVDIRHQDILETIEVQCREDGIRYIIPLEEYRRINYEICNDPESSQEQQSRQYSPKHFASALLNLQLRGEKESSQDSSSQENDQQQQQEFYQTSEIVVRKRGRPKGSKNKKKQGQQPSQSDKQDEFEEEHKRGRGRPKGSKNKKNLLKIENSEAMKDTFLLRVLMSGYLKRGKGRPKGSKNKPKLKQQYVEPPVKEEAIFWKRGKGRPKGSKNKIKNLQKTIEKFERLNVKEEVKEKRTRGRPKGVRNRPKSQPSIQSSSQQNEQGELPQVPDIEMMEQIDCCKKCKNRNLMEHLLSLDNEVEWLEFFEQNTVYNLHENLGPERRENLFLTAIHRNSPELLQLLLDRQNLRTTYFRCCWETESKLELEKYTVRTSKQCLSRSGKEGIYALLHDCCDQKIEPWWKIIGTQRILEAMDNWTSPKILEVLVASSPKLAEEMYLNIPTLIRAGNTEVAKHLLKDVLASQDTQDYSIEHYQCLESDVQQHYKKMNIFRRNSSSSYCSAIHCASINSNQQILENLVKTFSNYNVSDSLGRKPIHYAAAVSDSTGNMETLLKYGSDLKDLDKQKMTPLMIACYYGRSHIVRYILDNFTETLYVNFKSDEGFAALHYAVLNNHEDCVSAMMNYETVDVNTETKDKQTALHLAAGVGNPRIIKTLLTHGAYVDYYDRCKRTPFMFALRNNNYDAFRVLINEGVKLYKCDSSLNSMLHYATAYGNYPVLQYLKGVVKQSKNKSNLYPWEIAVGKGHLACSQLLDDRAKNEQDRLDFSSNIMMSLMSKITGTQQAMDMLVYLLNSKYFPINSQDYNGYTLLHYCCSISQEDYIKARSKELYEFSLREIKEEYRTLQEKVITLLLKYGLNRGILNKNKDTAFEMCVENGNLTGIRLLMNDDIDLEYQTSNGTTIMQYLSNMAALGTEEIKFVYHKLTKYDTAKLKESLKKADGTGCEPLLQFFREFTVNAKSNFLQNIERIRKKQLEGRGRSQKIQRHVDEQAEAFKQLQEHEDYFLKIVKLFVDAGANIHGTVQDRNNKEANKQRKWTIYHFAMRFPSLKLLDFLYQKFKDPNVKDAEGRTPLHYFCMWNVKGSLLNTPSLDNQSDYTGERSLTYLLQHGSNIKIADHTGSTALLYAALNKQIAFIVIMAKHDGQFNICNKDNQVPLIEIIKLKDAYSTTDIEQLFSIGADPNFEDLEQRNCLHHLVSNAVNFDTSPEICKILFEHGIKINGLDKYKRTPLFYCFTSINNRETDGQESPNDKVEILQALLSHKDINLNCKDQYGRTAIHYACERDFFFAILYLIDKKIDTTIRDSEGNTPLALCFIHRNLNQAVLLMKLGVSEGFVYEDGETISYFSYAFTRLSVQVCYMLLEYGYPLETALAEVSTHEAFKKILIKKYRDGRQQL